MGLVFPSEKSMMFVSSISFEFKHIMFDKRKEDGNWISDYYCFMLANVAGETRNFREETFKFKKQFLHVTHPQATYFADKDYLIHSKRFLSNFINEKPLTGWLEIGKEIKPVSRDDIKIIFPEGEDINLLKGIAVYCLKKYNPKLLDKSLI